MPTIRIAAALALFTALSAQGQTVPEVASAMAGEYTLASSTTTDPKSNWRYARSRVAIVRLDPQYLAFYQACEWVKSPKEACDDWHVLQQRADGIWLQDTNTGSMGMHFDPSTRTLTMTMESVNGEVRTDVFRPDSEPLRDPALMRRLKRAERNFRDTIAEKAFGKYTRWDYTRLRVYPPVAPQKAR